MMNFKSVMIQAVGAKPSGKKAAKKLNDNKNNHPLLWRGLHAVVSHRYEQDTGEKAPAMGADWSALLDWLVANLPKILALILAIFGA